jgi:hypothetical protein
MCGRFQATTSAAELARWCKTTKAARSPYQVSSRLFLGADKLAYGILRTTDGVLNLALGLFSRSLSFHLLVASDHTGSVLDLAARFLSGSSNAILVYG